MDGQLTNTPASSTVDLSGLPEPVAQSIKQLVDSIRERLPTGDQPGAPPHRPLRGRFADLKLPISKEDFDEAQREAWANFPRDFPDAGAS